MEEAKKLIEELKAIRGNSDQQSRDRINEIAKWFENNKTEENLKLLNDFIDKGIEEMEASTRNSASMSANNFRFMFISSRFFFYGKCAPTRL